MKILHFFCRLSLSLVLLLSGTFANAKYPVKKLSTIFIDHAVQGINPSISSTNNVLQLFTHGRPGELFINNEWKSKEAIAVWLKENYTLANYKHINIYGCEFAKGEKGLAAVKYLEQHLAVAIAASTNITGKDGDWLLEIGAVDGSFFSNYVKGNLQLAPTDDFDGDGILNSTDIDDDNDGITDVVECETTSLIAPTAGTASNALSPSTAMSAANSAEPAFGGTVELTDELPNPISNENLSAYFSANGVDNAVLNYTFNSSTLSGLVMWLPGINTGAFAHNDGPVRQFIATVTHSGGVTAFPVFTTIVSGKAQTFEFGTTLNGVTNVKIDILNGWVDNLPDDEIDYRPSGSSTEPNKIAHGGVYNVILSELRGVFTTSCRDTDADGITNNFDLDSDGDGCADAKEAGVTGTLQNGDILNGTPNSTTNVSNAVAAGPYGANGLANSLEGTNDTQNATTSYISTYNIAALVTVNNYCIDTDNDGVPDLTDIDDDNDGIVDAVESPTCFFTISEVNTLKNVTSDFAWSTTFPLTRAYDKNDANFAEMTTPANVQIMGKSLIDFELSTSIPQTVSSVSLLFARVDWGGSQSYRLEGWNGTSWIALSPSVANGTTDNVTHTFNNTLQPNAAFLRFRIAGTANAFTYGNGQLKEAKIEISNFNPSKHPTPTCTGSFADNDAFPPHLDLDSDGDGCSDSYEFGAIASEVTNHTFGTSITDTNADGLHEGNGIDGNADGITNYNPTLGFLKVPSLSKCKDTDSDLIPDYLDIDDDNDGILDSKEGLLCTITDNTGRAIVWDNEGEKTTPANLAFFSSKPNRMVTAGPGASLFASGGSWRLGSVENNGTLVDAVVKEEYQTATFTTGNTSLYIDSWIYFTIFNTHTTPRTLPKVGILIDDDPNFGTPIVINNESGPAPTIAQAANNIDNTILPVSNPSFLNRNTQYFVRFYDLPVETIFDDVSHDLIGLGFKLGPANSGPDCGSDIDTDGDNIPNRLDLDSDGDGCSDAFETGVTGTLIKGMLMNKSGITNSNNAVAQGGYGANGFANALETVVESGTYTGSYTNYTNATNGVLSSGCIILPQTKPDINNSYVGMEVRGNVSTNDSVPVGSTYSNLTLLPGYTNPAGDLPVLTGTDGTYTFTATTTPGIYKFLITVCPPGLTVGCPIEVLAITVLDRNVQTNPPSATVDFAKTKMDVPVTLPTMENDKSGNSMTTLDPATVSVTVSPKRGTVTVNPANGNTTYTPEQGFIGIDTLTYTICDNATPTINCATALQIITVLPTAANNSMQATDDYNTTSFNTPATGLVLTNDMDPEGNNKRALVQNTTAPNKGTLILNTDGSYTFTPEPGFIGSVNFPYTACDDGNPEACRRATLHIFVLGPISTLPVKLISFHGYNKRNGNMLEWKTSSEINSSYFDILYSHSGKNFVKIGTLSTAGNSSAELAYNYLHAQAQAGNNFYQLVSVDVDGKKEYSSIINIRMNTNSKLTVSPVPAKNEVTIKASKEELLTLKLYSITGQDVTAMVRIVKLSETVSMIYINQLPSGIYYLKTKTQSTKIIKQ